MSVPVAGKKIFIATETFTPSIARDLESQGFQLRFNPHHRCLTPEDYAVCLDGVELILAGVEPYREEVFSRHPALRVLSRIGTGVDSIDLDAARSHGVAVYNTPDAPTRSVAELTVGFILCLLRGIPQMSTDFHQGLWKPFLGRELAERKVGLLGLGRIGGGVAERLQPFGVSLLACDPRWDEAKARRFGVKRVSFEELLAQSDLLSLHLPLEPATRHLLDGPRLDRMKPGAFLINTSRGGIVHDAALLERLRSGRLGGAALDVFEAEPDTAPYRGAPHLLLSPHAGAATTEARARMEGGAVENLFRWIRATERGESPPPGVTR